MKTSLTILASLATLLSFPASGQAQSFDCSAATTATEHAICDSRSLSNLDMKMGTLYSVVEKLPMMMGASGNRSDAAHAFITKRDACGAQVSCLSDAYEARNKALAATIDSAMQDYCKAIDLC